MSIPRGASGRTVKTATDPSGSIRRRAAFVSISSMPAEGSTYGVAADAEGNGWWSQFLADFVTKADVKTGERFEILMRDPQYEARRALMTSDDLAFYDAAGAQSWGGYPVNPVPWASAPRRLSADQKGNTVWVPNWASGMLAKVDIRTLKPPTTAYRPAGTPIIRAWTRPRTCGRTCQWGTRSLSSIPGRNNGPSIDCRVGDATRAT